MSVVSQPSGTVTLVFSDIEGSTKLLHSLGTEAYRGALAEHRRIVREAYARYSGYEVDYEGDAFFYAFSSASDALSAVSEAMAGLEGGPIRIRVGIHTGEPGLDPPKYVGMDVHFAARVMSSAHGGQVVLSASTASLLDRDDLHDLGEHRFKDLSAPARVYQLGAGDFPALRTIANSNLPTPASSFVGREQELYEADRLLQSTRLLTIAGPGGQGKTRIALELARRAREERFSDYPQGVFACFLASLRDPSLVVRTLCQTLSVTEQPGHSALDALSTHLQGKRMLLLLDNAEHLLSAATDLSHLLQQAEGLTLLVTSRELLRVQGETSYALPPLADDEGIALFCERARTEPAPAIAELCARLEGLPLAIELAAARTAILTPTQLLERLSQRLDLLKGGRDADPRQQTLRATIEWSYDLLRDDEQRLFRALSVFQGGCTLEAAEEVCGADLDTLHSLVDKSLLRFTQERFWMLETLREYAGERLADSGEAAAGRDRHAAYYSRLAVVSEVALRGAESAEALDRLHGDQHNLRAAIDFDARTNPARAVRLLSSLRQYWWHVGPVEAEQRLRALLEQAPELSDVERAKALLTIGTLAMARGDHRRALDVLGESVRVARRLDDLVLLGRALNNHGAAALELVQIDVAEASFEQAAAIRRSMGDEVGYATSLNNLAVVASRKRELGRARALYEETIEIRRAYDSPVEVAYTLGNLAAVAMAQGAIRDARASALEGLELLAGHESPRVRLHLHLQLGTCDLIEGADEGARRHLRLAATEYRALGTEPELIELIDMAAEYAALLDARAAVRLVGARDALAAAIGYAASWWEVEQRERLFERIALELGEQEVAHELEVGSRLSAEEALTLVDSLLDASPPGDL